ncbi:hypothetical protein TEQG_05583 [Trichophyton equinum CBS 127.97]|uniref:Uncharacterized protein n=1 Tax=Trichophyton equinum (strain ATCC MYA-4606 / CBS 127.97) TaxID=559882 RepID=F2PXG7_TRIEC|nr:hypothetical protein TEQG_05583 [Trichophyton equinum CBS 127.97]
MEAKPKLNVKKTKKRGEKQNIWKKKGPFQWRSSSYQVTQWRGEERWMAEHFVAFNTEEALLESHKQRVAQHQASILLSLLMMLLLLLLASSLFGRGSPYPSRDADTCRLDGGRKARMKQTKDKTVLVFA